MRTPNNRVKYTTISHNICNINIDFILALITLITLIILIILITSSVTKIKNNI